MRLLVLDGSRALHSQVRRLAPGSVRVQTVFSFGEALAALRRDPPEAAIFNLTPSDLPWAQLQRLCREHSPPIPVLYESCVHSCLCEAGLGETDQWSAFLAKPYRLADLRSQIEELVRKAERAPATQA